MRRRGEPARRHWRPALRALAGLLAAAAGAACAQGVAGPGASSPGFVLPPVAGTTAADSGLPTGDQPAFVREIIVRGNRAIPTGELQALVAGDLGRLLTAADFEDLRQRLTRHYVDRGFINSGAVFQAGALSGETLVVDIVEGQLDLVRLDGLGGLRPSYVIERLLPDAAAPLNIEDLRERFALLLDDPLFAKLNLRLTPGTRLGQAQLEVEAVRARPFQLQVFANNHRPPSVGADAYGFHATVRNITGFGDALEASVLRPFGAAASGGRHGVTWRLPIPGTAADVSLQHEAGSSSVIEEVLRPLDIRSRLRSDEVALRYVLEERLRRKIVLGLARVSRRNATQLLGQPFSFTPEEPTGRVRIASWRFWQEATFRTAAQVLALRSTLAASRTNLQDDPAVPSPGAIDQPHRYAYWQGQAHLAREIGGDGAQLVARLAVQAARRPLLALDRFPVGGASSVRGFRENTLVRDRGAVLNLEFEHPALRFEHGGGRWALVPFVDAGYAANVGGASDRLASAGLLARLRWQGLSVDLAWGRRLAGPPAPAQRTLQDRGVHLQVAYSVF